MDFLNLGKINKLIKQLGDAIKRVDNLKNPLSTIPINGGKVLRVAIVGDSFVGGAGVTAPLTFCVQLASAVRAKYGDAGAGYIPWADAKMPGMSHSAGWTSQIPNGPGSILWPWTSAYRATAPNGLAYYRSGGTGQTDNNESITYIPNNGDSFQRGVVDTITNVSIHFTSRLAYTGFAIRENNTNLNSAFQVSTGATFTGSATASTTLAASGVTGVISQSAYLTGTSVPEPRTIKSGAASSYGGSGNYTINSSATITGTVNATGNSAAVVGIPSKIEYSRNQAQANNIQVTGLYGDVLINGIEYYNGNAGVTFSDFGQGGTTAVQYASLNDAAQRSFWQMMAFDLVIVVLGMNDRADVAPAMYGTAMQTIVSRIKSCPYTKVIIVRQTDPSDAATTNWAQFESVLKNVAISTRSGYYDMKTASPNLANYTLANASGLMTDGVHLNGSGNTLVGSAFAPYVIDVLGQIT